MWDAKPRSVHEDATSAQAAHDRYVDEYAASFKVIPAPLHSVVEVPEEAGAPASALMRAERMKQNMLTAGFSAGFIRRLEKEWVMCICNICRFRVRSLPFTPCATSNPCDGIMAPIKVSVEQHPGYPDVPGSEHEGKILDKADYGEESG